MAEGTFPLLRTLHLRNGSSMMGRYSVPDTFFEHSAFTVFGEETGWEPDSVPNESYTDIFYSATGEYFTPLDGIPHPEGASDGDSDDREDGEDGEDVDGGDVEDDDGNGSDDDDDGDGEDVADRHPDKALIEHSMREAAEDICDFLSRITSPGCPLSHLQCLALGGKPGEAASWLEVFCRERGQAENVWVNLDWKDVPSLNAPRKVLDVSWSWPWYRPMDRQPVMKDMID